MIDKFTNAVKRHTSQQDYTKSHPQWATVVSYDPATGLARVMLQPEQELTGWIPVLFPTVGKNMGLICPPVAGQMALVCFEGGSHDDPVVMGGSFSNLSPVATIGGNPVQSGEIAIIAGNNGGSSIYMKANGDVDIVSTTTVNVTAPTTKITGNLEVTGSVTGGYGTGDQVGLQSHDHNYIPGSGSPTTTSPPVAGS